MKPVFNVIGALFACAFLAFLCNFGNCCRNKDEDDSIDRGYTNINN